MVRTTDYIISYGKDVVVVASTSLAKPMVSVAKDYSFHKIGMFSLDNRGRTCNVRASKGYEKDEIRNLARMLVVATPFVKKAKKHRIYVAYARRHDGFDYESFCADMESASIPKVYV